MWRVFTCADPIGENGILLNVFVFMGEGKHLYTFTFLLLSCFFVAFVCFLIDRLFLWSLTCVYCFNRKGFWMFEKGRLMKDDRGLKVGECTGVETDLQVVFHWLKNMKNTLRIFFFFLSFESLLNQTWKESCKH